MPPLFSISLAQWSLHRMIFAGELHPLDFPRFAKDTFGIDAVEFVNRCFKDHFADDDLSYLPELKQRCDDHGVKPLLYMIDRQGDLGDPAESQRIRAVNNHRKWLEAVSYLGGHAIRVNARSEGTREEQAKLAADGLRRLCEYAEPFGLSVLVENHGGPSSDGAWLAGVMGAVDHPCCGTLPDFGNFCLDWNRREDPAAWYDKYRGVEELMPFARAVSAKSGTFTPDGDERTIDYGRMLRIVLDAGFRGHIGIEFEGDETGERDGVRRTLRLLERWRDALAPEYDAEEVRG